MDLNFNPDTSKDTIFEEVSKYLQHKDLKIHKQDNTRPWGGFFVIEENQAEKFIQLYFPHLTKGELTISGKLSPKILVVASNKRLSWRITNLQILRG